MSSEDAAQDRTTRITEEAAAAAHALSELAERDPQLAGQLARLVSVIAAEAGRSTRISKALRTALDVGAGQEESSVASRARRPHRRTPGVLDPFTVYADSGEQGLRDELAKLDLEQLRDIVAEHQMDHDRLAMKWKDTARVIDRITERVAVRAAKGSAFRPPQAEPPKEEPPQEEPPEQEPPEQDINPK
ncbi:hypothetical protein ACFYYP_04120 [Microbispora rosea]|uniref:hypothetical protein n=1 Tax=Microbispora rosea TaxID=58117 RepID=UPI003682A919